MSVISKLFFKQVSLALNEHSINLEIDFIEAELGPLTSLNFESPSFTNKPSLDIFVTCLKGFSWFQYKILSLSSNEPEEFNFKSIDFISLICSKTPEIFF